MLTASEQLLIARYRAFDKLEKLALRAWIIGGDARLMFCLCIGFSLRENLHPFAPITAPEC